MAEGVAGRLRGFLGWLRGRGVRGLVVLHASDLSFGVEVFWRATPGGSCLLVSPRGDARRPGGCEAAGPGSVARLLGREYDYAVLAFRGLLRPNIVAALAGVVRGGGSLALVVPPLGAWEPGLPGGAGGWKRYLVHSIGEASPLFWASLDTGEVFADRRPELRLPANWPPGPSSPPARGVPASLWGLAATPSQARVLAAAARLASGRTRSLFVTGGRGRGKSFALGLASALLAARGVAGEAHVVAPDPCQLDSFYRGLLAGLRVLGRKTRVTRDRSGCITLVRGQWFRFAYQDPSTGEPAGLLVVDEAAAVGLARLRRLSWRSGRVLAASTLHGYEGSGTALARMASNILPRPLEEVELVEPIRYPPGDPLEEWSYRVFVLDTEPGPPPRLRGEPRYRRLAPGELAERPGLVRSVQRLLAQAHYRTEPDYLLTILDSPRHTLHLLETGEGGLVAVADTAVEEWGLPEEERLGLRSLWLALGAPRGWRAPRLVRVVRIAVHPGLQGRGLGSRLLGLVEGWARESRAELVVALFARHDVLGFWLRCGYTVFYVSPRFNRVTGEKNIGVARPLTVRGLYILEEASRKLRARLVLGAHVSYRDLGAEKIVALLDHSQPTKPPLEPPGRGELEPLLQGVVEHEQVVDAVYRAAVALYASAPQGRLEALLPPGCPVLIAAHLLQGKPLHEASSIAGVDLEHARSCIETLARLLA